MSGALGWSNAPWLVVLGGAVLLAVLTSTLAVLAFEAWCLLRRGRSAPARYRAALNSLGTALVLAVLGPGLTLALALSSTAPSPIGPTAANTDIADVSASPSAGAPRVAAALPRSEAGPVPQRWPHMPSQVLGLVGALWAVGAVVMLARLLLSWRAATRLRQRACLLDEGPLRAMFERLCEGTRAGQVRIGISTEIDAPVALGVREPAVLLPSHVLDSMPDESLAPVLAHELAHVERRDYAVHLAQTAAEAVLWHSPAIWWLGGRIRELREFCCDDAAVEVAGSHARYAEALTLVARLGTLVPTRVVIGMAGPRLITRVRRLLQGEPAMSLPVARAALVIVVAAVAAALMPAAFTANLQHVSAHLLAAGQERSAIPRGFPQRQDGSSLRIVRVESTDTHVCGTFEVQNLASMAVAQVRFVGVLSFKPGANRPVQITESDWLTHVIPAGATVRLDVPLLDIDAARREGGGEHVQAYCAVREVVYENRVAWGVTPNPAATTDLEALGNGRWPTLPRAFVGQTRAAAYPRLTLCMDAQAKEYSPGAQVAISDEPGKAARCTPTGQWVEVNARTGVPLPLPRDAGAGDVVTLEVAAEGLSRPVSLTSAAGALAVVQVAGGRSWGVVPSIDASGRIDVALHDMSTSPHRLVRRQTLQRGVPARFDDNTGAVSLTLAAQ